jgi:hypothetical protein
MKFVVEIGKREKVGKRCLNIACTTTSAKCTATPMLGQLCLVKT